MVSVVREMMIFVLKVCPVSEIREFLPPRTMIFRVFFQSYNSMDIKQ